MWGKTDLLINEKDYTRVKDELVSAGNDVHLQEFPYGHLGLVVPRDNDINDAIIKSIVGVTD